MTAPVETSRATVLGGAYLATILALSGCSQFEGASAPPASVRTETALRSASFLYSVLPPWRQLAAPAYPLPPESPAEIAPDAGGTVVYVSLYKANAIECFALGRHRATYLGSMTAGLVNPQGEAVTLDAPDKQKLIVANTGAQNVLIYAGKCQSAKLIRTLNDSGSYPGGVAAASNGNIYVTSVTGVSAPGQVRLYTPNDNTGVQIGDPILYKVYFVAVKPDDSVVCVDGYKVAFPTEAEVDCSKNHGKTWFASNYAPVFPGGLAFDKFNHLVVDDQAGNITDLGNGISFPCPRKGECVGIAFSPDFEHLFTGDSLGNRAYELNWLPGPSGKIDVTMPARVHDATVVYAQPVPGI